MSLRALARVILIVACAFSVAVLMAIERRTASPAVALAGGMTLLLCGAAFPVAMLRWVRPRTSAMMLATRRRARQRAAAGRAPDIAFDWIDLEHISRSMRLAAIAAEDGYFCHHSGFDWQSIRDAHAHNMTHAQKRGGSTITQQVAKNLFLWRGRSYVRKALEAGLTLMIESLWPKRRILEVYLNVAQFGDGLFGVQAAARRYFNVPAASLTPEQAALLAAALPNPALNPVSAPTHQMRFRQVWILAAMRRLGDHHLDRL
jgi:monofunctional biosynthetic peptidoglycan transglycosylase